ncbi:MAG: cation diffusion facilitator family transporter [Acidobacteriota bacterium]
MGHDHDHAHGAGDYGRAFLIGIALNLSFVVLEVIYGVLSHSMSLLADAGHNFGDVLGLGLSWGASILARQRASSRRTYGFGSSSILAALANAVLLLVATGAVAWESIQRLLEPHHPVAGGTMIAVAAVGIAINVGSALLFRAGSKRDLNLRSAFLHLMGDAAIALGVVIAGAVIAATGWQVVDPITSLLVCAAILFSTWSLLRESLDLVLDAVPAGIDPDAVRSYLLKLPDVVEIHDLHIWPLSTTETALTVHLVMPSGPNDRQFLRRAGDELHDKFGIAHATLQIEPHGPEPCDLAEHV